MALERTPVLLHGYSGELIDAGSNALYWEATFSGRLLLVQRGDAARPGAVSF
jgi:hypothetical protein